MAISDKLVAINSIKQDIKQAIVDKGIDMTNTPFTNYADKIDSIESGSGLTENEIIEFTDENIVPITIAVYGDGAGGMGYLTVKGSMSSNGENPTTLGSIPHWYDKVWKYFYIFVNKSQHRYISIDAPTDTRQYIKLNYNNLGTKETYTRFTWLDLNNVRGMLFEFQAYD